MPRVMSVHEYELKAGVSEADFARALRDAEQRGLFALPGLVDHHFLKGLKGHRRGAYAAIWIFDSVAAWEALWGPVESPRPPSEYPEAWKIWEQEILVRFLTRDPDTIRFTSYTEL
jgi:hypothetical protein